MSMRVCCAVFMGYCCFITNGEKIEIEGIVKNRLGKSNRFYSSRNNGQLKLTFVEQFKLVGL